jgi:translation initiation factor 3 subunit F
VIFNILNAYTRKNPQDVRIIGSLLGEIRDNGQQVVITECFVVPLSESLDEHWIRISEEYHKTMYGYHRRNCKKEFVVGWFSTATNTGQLIVDNSSLVHHFYTTEIATNTGIPGLNWDPIHLVVDTRLGFDFSEYGADSAPGPEISSTIPVRAFVSQESMVGNDSLATAFHEIPCHVKISDAEASLLYTLGHSQVRRPWSSGTVLATLSPSSSSSSATIQPQQKVKRSIEQLKYITSQLLEYVKAVNDNSQLPNRQIGMMLMEALTNYGPQPLVLNTDASNSATITPTLSNNNNHHLHASGLLQQRYTDLLMAAYLATVTQTQTTISEKINQIL